MCTAVCSFPSLQTRAIVKVDKGETQIRWIYRVHPAFLLTGLPDAFMSKYLFLKANLLSSMLYFCTLFAKFIRPESAILVLELYVPDGGQFVESGYLALTTDIAFAALFSSSAF